MRIAMALGESSLKIEAGASLRTLAVNRIRTEISEGRMEPGARLVERDICDALGVSRTVIREALRQLEAEGYIAQSKRGPIVAPLDPDTIRSIYEVREALETKAAALFVERASAEDKERVTALADRLLVFEREGDHVEGLKILDEFCRALMQGSGNLLFASILAPLTGRVHILQVQAAMSPDRRAAAIAELRVLAKALVSGDARAAEDAARRRLRGAAAFALAAHRRKLAGDA